MIGKSGKALALAALMAAGGGRGWAESRPPDVVLVTIDTLRADYVGVYGRNKAATPALDSLAGDGAYFADAYCQTPITPPSHASILTGTYPATHGLRDFTSTRVRPGVPSMAETLRKRGYRTAAFVSAFVLDRSWGLDAGFDFYWDEFKPESFEGVNPGNVQRRGDETMDRALAWLTDVQSPFFLWVHLFDPHHDYSPPEPFKSLYKEDPYAGEVAFADRQVGRLLEALKARGLYSGALIVATSDHGEGLGEHQEKEHGFFLYEATLRIPLIVKPPADLGVRGRRIDTIAQTVDIFPTVLQILRAPVPGAVEGTGLLSTILGKRRQAGFAYAETLYPRTTFGWSSLRAYRDGAHKVIDAPRPELYDLSDDPAERDNRYSEQSALANQLMAKLRRLQSDLQASPPGDESPPDPERLQRLAALGYVSLERPMSLDGRSDSPDPKDKIGVYNKILEGLQAAEAGQLERSNAILEEVETADPQLFIVPFSLGNNYLKLSRPEKALAAFQRAGKLNPEFPSAQVNAARALSMLKRDGEAIALLEALAADSGSHEAGAESIHQSQQRHLAVWRELALLYSRNGRAPEAISIYRKILSERPADPQALQFMGIALVETKSYEEGLQKLDAAIAAGLDNALIRNFRGIALANQDRREEAIASYRESIRINPGYPLPRLNLALTLLQAGRVEEARREFAALCGVNAALCDRYRSRFK